MKQTLTTLITSLKAFFTPNVYEDTEENAADAAIMQMLLG